MKPATVHQIKEELIHLEKEELVKICLRLAKYKKENKELLSYVLFEMDDESAYIKTLKEEIHEQFKAVNTTSFYLAKKTIRKVLRYTDRFVRYSDKKETEVELRLYFCQEMKSMGMRMERSRVVLNIYQNQLKKINKLIAGLHEDLQYDYLQEFEELRLSWNDDTLLCSGIS